MLYFKNKQPTQFANPSNIDIIFPILVGYLSNKQVAFHQYFNNPSTPIFGNTRFLTKVSGILI